MNREQRRRAGKAYRSLGLPDGVEPMTVTVRHSGSSVGLAVVPDLEPTRALMTQLSPAQARERAKELLDAAEAAEAFASSSSAA